MEFVKAYAGQGRLKPLLGAVHLLEMPLLTGHELRCQEINQGFNASIVVCHFFMLCRDST